MIINFKYFLHKHKQLIITLMLLIISAVCFAYNFIIVLDASRGLVLYYIIINAIIYILIIICVSRCILVHSRGHLHNDYIINNIKYYKRFTKSSKDGDISLIDDLELYELIQYIFMVEDYIESQGYIYKNSEFYKGAN